MQPLRKGIYHLAKDADDTPVTPVAMHGLGRSMPKGASMIVRFNCDVVVGECRAPGEDADRFMNDLNEDFQKQLKQCLTRREEID